MLLIFFFLFFCYEWGNKFFVFFFQAEDGIRAGTVTGVQTCALPIWARHRRLDRLRDRDAERSGMVRVQSQDFLPDVRAVARARDDLRPEEAHHVLAVRL